MASPQAGSASMQKRVDNMSYEELLEAWRKGYTARQRNQETLGSDPIVGLFPFLERLSRRIKLPVPFPETVVYEHSFPKGWYWFEPPRRGEEAVPQDLSKLNSLLDGSLACGDDDHRTVSGDQLRSVTSKGCETAAIRESFSRRPIVASATSRIVAQVVKRSADSDNIVVEYLDRESLDGFFKNCPDQCILSKFVPPKGTKNDIVVAIWLRDRLVIRRHRNNNDIYDTSKSVYETGCVDNPTLCTQIFSPAVVTRLISKTMRVLIREIESYEKKHVVEFQAHFKVGFGSRLYLLWITKLAMIRLPNPLGRFGLSELSNYHVDAKKRRIAVADWRPPHDKADRNALRQRGALLSNFIQKSIGDRRSSVKAKRDMGWPSFYKEEETIAQFLQRSNVDPALIKKFPKINEYLTDPPEVLHDIHVFADFSRCTRSTRDRRRADSAPAEGLGPHWKRRYTRVTADTVCPPTPRAVTPCNSLSGDASDESDADREELFASWAHMPDNHVSWADDIHQPASAPATKSPTTKFLSPSTNAVASPHSLSPSLLEDENVLEEVLRDRPPVFKNPFSPETLSLAQAPVLSPMDFALAPMVDGQTRKSSVFYRKNIVQTAHSPPRRDSRGLSPTTMRLSTNNNEAQSPWADLLPVVAAKRKLLRVTQQAKDRKADAKELERRELVKGLKSETRAQYERARENSDRITTELEDVEYELYSQVLSMKSTDDFSFSLPEGCPVIHKTTKLGDLEITPVAHDADVDDAASTQSPRSPRHGPDPPREYSIRVDGSERLYQLKRAMQVLKKKVYVSLSRKERALLLKDFGPKVLAQLKYHSRPGYALHKRRSLGHRRLSSVASMVPSDPGDEMASEATESDSSGEILAELEKRTLTKRNVDGDGE